MATQTLLQPRRIGSTAHMEPEFVGGPEATYYKETASQTFGIGDLVYLDSNGTVAICTTNSTLHDSPILGQARKAATGTTGASVHLAVISPDDKFIMNVYHATPASAVSALTQLGTVRGIILASSKWHVDIANTVEGSNNALARVKIVGFPSTVNGVANTIGDTYGFVIVKFLELSIAMTGTLAGERILQG